MNAQIQEFSADRFASLPSLSCVYTVFHRDTGNTYVGGTRNLRRRMQTFIRRFRRGIAPIAFKTLSEPLRRGAFGVRILEACDVIHLPAREKFWREKLNPTLNKTNSYHQTQTVPSGGRNRSAKPAMS